MGRNPATGEAIKIKASKKVAFRGCQGTEGSGVGRPDALVTVTPHQHALPIIGAKAQKPMHSARYPAPTDYRPIHASNYDSEDRAGTVKLFGAGPVIKRANGC